jgi:KaiC/GvpD/RAD55 family RecA-like ATPase
MKKVPTGVEGLDNMLGGGLPFGRCTLICGGPGSGKTTFAVQFLYNGAKKYGETGLYVSLGESPVHLRENMASFGLDIEGLEKEGKFMIIDASPIRTLPGEVKIGDLNIGKRDFSMLSLIEGIRNRAEEKQVKRIVVDPITTLMLQYPDVVERQNAVLDLMETITDLDITSLMTTELRATSLKRQVQAEEFLSHGVLIFHRFTEDGRIIRAIQVEKMRGIAHDYELRPYKIQKNGIEIFPKEKIISRT